MDPLHFCWKSKICLYWKPKQWSLRWSGYIPWNQEPITPRNSQASIGLASNPWPLRVPINSTVPSWPQGGLGRGGPQRGLGCVSYTLNCLLAWLYWILEWGHWHRAGITLLWLCIILIFFLNVNWNIRVANPKTSVLDVKQKTPHCLVFKPNQTIFDCTPYPKSGLSYNV